jgi:type II secretory ATPase GspE/PulE/Tfp pilus assembly ATPase PilB-like protein
MDNLGMSDQDLARARRLCGLPNGLVIVTGPTGCGKTTTNYCMLQSINTPERAILTAEDPVEYLIDGMAQTPVNPKVGMTFPRIIRHMLRQAPNVMMVGEIRDLETAELCVQAALTGHLLFTTLHTNTAPQAIKRLLDIGIKPFLINNALAGVIAQRLVRTLCNDCKKPAKPPAHTMPPEAVEVIAGFKDAQFQGPVGCDACRQTGYRGRTAIYEILVMDDRIRQILSESADMAALEDAARAAGMRTMMADGLDKAARGITSVEEVMRTAPRAIGA